MARDRTSYPLKRKVWIGLLALAVAVGIFARGVGSGDSSARYRARDAAAEGLEALLSGRYGEARSRLDIAVRHDPEFAEGFLALGLTSFALADFDRADQAANRALELLKSGPVDPQAWSGKLAGRLRAEVIAQRTLCLTRVARELGLGPSEAATAYEIAFEVLQEPDCAGAESALRRRNDRGTAYRTVVRAMERCPGHWRCARSSK